MEKKHYELLVDAYKVARGRTRSITIDYSRANEENLQTLAGYGYIKILLVNHVCIKIQVLPAGTKVAKEYLENQE